MTRVLLSFALSLVLVARATSFDTFTDDFNRADGAIGTNWTCVGAISISSNVVIGNAASTNSTCRYTAATWDAAQTSQIEITDAGFGGTVGVRMQADGDGYYFVVAYAAARFYRRDGGMFELVYERTGAGIVNNGNPINLEIDANFNLVGRISGFTEFTYDDELDLFPSGDAGIELYSDGTNYEQGDNWVGTGGTAVSGGSPLKRHLLLGIGL